MSRFLDQIRKAKEARLEAEQREKKTAEPAGDKKPGEEKPLVPEMKPPPSPKPSPEASAPRQSLFPGELAEKEPPPAREAAEPEKAPPHFPGAMQPLRSESLETRKPEARAAVPESKAHLPEPEGKPSPKTAWVPKAVFQPEAQMVSPRVPKSPQAEAFSKVEAPQAETVPKIEIPPKAPVDLASEEKPLQVPDEHPRKAGPLESAISSEGNEQDLFPRELEDQGLSGDESAEASRRKESPLFVQAGKQTDAGGVFGRRRVQRIKGEIPIPGPEPDQAFLNRIACVTPRPDKRILSFYEPKHHICEEYRLLGKNLLHSFANGSENLRRGKIIVLTSSVRGEGKTLTCMNLAQTLAQDLANRVLLLDGDMRHPKVHRYMGLPPSAGLNDLLACSDPQSMLEDCLVRTDTGLHLLMAQTARGNPAPMLDSPNMTRILDLLRDRYSLVIVDTPPVLLATDSLTLGARSDGMLFLLRARKTKREQIQEARQRIARLEIRLLGYVINNVKTFLPKIWSRYYYGNY